MKNSTRRSVPSQMIIGAIVIALGIGFLLDNLDILNFGDVFSFWPTVFIVIGSLKLADSRDSGGATVGAVLVGLGLLLIMRNLGFFYVDLRTIWPLALIFVGGTVVYRSFQRRQRVELGKEPEGSHDANVDATAILGGFERRVTTPNFQGGDITAIMGGCEIDLRGSSIQGEAVVNVFAAMGGISLKVPSDWTVILHGTPILGGFEEKTVTPADGSTRLIFNGYAFLGGVVVRN